MYTTIIKAMVNSSLTTFAGPNVPGINFKDAQRYCEQNGLGYCRVDGMLVAEIPCKKGTTEPDWSRKVDFENYN